MNPIVAALGGAALVWAAIKQARTATDRHYEQTRADQQRRVIESFSKAVEQLGSEKIEIRLGGIYTLERLAGEISATRRGTQRLGSELYWTVMETLTAFVRERTRWKEPEASASGIMAEADQSRSQRPSTDIAAVLEVIRRRPDAGRKHETRQRWRFDLNSADLRNVNLRGAHLERAYLIGAHFEGAILIEAHLEDADLGGANLEDANLRGAHLEGAYLGWAYLERANLGGAHLERAKLSGARLERADLIGAHLEGANLDGAHLEGAYLEDADLGGAHFGGAHLEGADLIGAHLEGVTHLSRAIGDAQTRLPDGVDRPTGWPPYKPGSRPGEASDRARAPRQREQPRSAQWWRPWRS